MWPKRHGYIIRDQYQFSQLDQHIRILLKLSNFGREGKLEYPHLNQPDNLHLASPESFLPYELTLGAELVAEGGHDRRHGGLVPISS